MMTYLSMYTLHAHVRVCIAALYRYWGFQMYTTLSALVCPYTMLGITFGSYCKQKRFTKGLIKIFKLWQTMHECLN